MVAGTSHLGRGIESGHVEQRRRMTRAARFVCNSKTAAPSNAAHLASVVRRPLTPPLPVLSGIRSASRTPGGGTRRMTDLERLGLAGILVLLAIAFALILIAIALGIAAIGRKRR
jgi:hypothetical protein